VNGVFVVVEGIDGCGSTTQAARLAASLRERGREVVTTCEPTQGPAGELIRQALRRELVGSGGAERQFDWATLALLFAADRLDHNHTVIEPALGAGRIVISDRYDLSSLAYQSVTASAGDGVVPWIRGLNARARRPDLTIVLDVGAEVAARRRQDRGGAAELFEVDALQRRLASVYARAEDLVPDDRVVHVSGEAAETAVGLEILAAFDEHIAAGSAQP
jgi:dTMP kinase